MGSALSGIATIAMGQMNASAKAQAATEDQAQEARVLDYNAQQTQRAGSLEGAKLRMQGSQLIDRQKVAYSNSGVDASSGTAASVMADTRLMSDLDAQTAENNAARQVWGYKLQKEQSKKNLQRTYDSANREAIGSALSGAGQIIGGSGSMSGGG